MRGWMGLAMTGLAAAAAGAAVAAPTVDIRNAVARVTVIPEARSDIAVTVIRTNSRLPIRVTRMGDRVRIDGDIGPWPHNCHAAFGRPGVMIWGLGEIGYDAMPQVVIRTPMSVEVDAGDAIFGAIGRSDNVTLANSGCGDWTIGNVADRLSLRLSGSGDVRAGGAGSADVRVSGSSDVTARAIRSGLTTAISGSGDVTADWVGGPLKARIAGSGDVRVHGGSVSAMVVAISGSGDVNFGGVAQTLDAHVAGSGDVTAAKVNGMVTKHVAGSGDVTVKSWAAAATGAAPH